MNRIVGAAVFVIGLILLAMGLNASDAPVEQVSETLTGRFTDETMWYLIGGAAAAVIGALLFVFGRRRI